MGPRQAVGLALVGYGFLLVVGLVAHEAAAAGWPVLLLGAFLLRGRRTVTTPEPPTGDASGAPPSLPALLAGGLGAALVVAVVAYNRSMGSAVGGPEWALLAYGLLLAAAAPCLGLRIRSATVATVVAWSFPLVLAPLALYAANGLLAQASPGAATPVLRTLLVVPTALLLELSGSEVATSGTTMSITTSRGTLGLGVGLVCAGIYPLVLFGSMVGLHAWRERMRPWVAARLAAAGLASLWLLDLVRLSVLAKVGELQGGAALQAWHDHLGWILFAAFSAVFWPIVLMRKQGGHPPAHQPAAG
jgi:exosortase/archaeosortase family protein